jgi:hypothetical protein
MKPGAFKLWVTGFNLCSPTSGSRVTASVSHRRCMSSVSALGIRWHPGCRVAGTSLVTHVIVVASKHIRLMTASMFHVNQSDTPWE